MASERRGISIALESLIAATCFIGLVAVIDHFFAGRDVASPGYVAGSVIGGLLFFVGYYMLTKRYRDR